MTVLRKVEVTCGIDIDAPAEVVWKALTELDRFHEWNPFIRAAKGEAKVGGRVRVRVKPSLPLPFPVVFHAIVTECEEARVLRWLGHSLRPRIGSGEHWFNLEPLDPHRTRFSQREVFTGILPRLFHRLLVRESLRGFEAMNAALKVRAEMQVQRARVAPPPRDVRLEDASSHA